MRFIIKLLVFIIAVGQWLGLSAQTKIYGENFVLDTNWSNIIYISLISAMDQLYTCSEEIIIGQADMDDKGNWQVIIPSTDYGSLIRLHVSKKRAPAASLIIGGPDENHGFYALHNQKELNITRTENQIFQSFFVENDHLNDRIFNLDRKYRLWESKDKEHTSLENKNESRRAFAHELITYADTCTMVLPAIYSTYLSDFGFNRIDVLNKMSDLRNKFGNHPYLMGYPSVINRPIHLWLMSVLLAILIGWLAWKWKENVTLRVLEERVSNLSPREYEVYQLLILGVSNKEIAAKLSVETSTIKSHVNKIYQKLGVRSRNEMRRYSEVEN